MWIDRKIDRLFVCLFLFVRDRDQHEQKNGMKSRKKKVTFNLNVQIYEANPTSYQVLENEEEENKGTTAESEGSEALTVRYPQNHRYHNCGDDYDEGDEIEAYEESDIDDEFDDDGYDWDDDDDDDGYDEAEVYDENSKQKELSESCYAEDRIKNLKPLAPNDAGLKSNLSGRDRSTNMHSVLIPVENLTQWKAIKAKVTSSKHRRKENVPSEQNANTWPLVSEASLSFSSPCVLESNALQSKPLLPEIAVDASLSNWLVSPNYNVSTTIRCQ